MKVEVDEVEAVPRTIVAIRRRVDLGPPLGERIGELYGQLYAALPVEVASGEGHNVIAYEPVGETTADMLVGREWRGDEGGAAAIEGLERVRLPGGRSAHVRHVGPYELLPQVHFGIHTWMRERGLREVGLSWEIYGDWTDDPSKLVTDVFYRLP